MSANRPPWIAGWTVLTRPSIISGAPVTSSTGMTGIPASASAREVPPLEMISHPKATSRWARLITPVLSYTDTNALGG